MKGRQLRITVEEDDISWGVAKDCDFCPIARAAGRTTREWAHVGVTTMGVGNVNYLLPLEAQNFIHAFDAGEAVNPFSFIVVARDVQ